MDSCHSFVCAATLLALLLITQENSLTVTALLPSASQEIVAKSDIAVTVKAYGTSGTKFICDASTMIFASSDLSQVISPQFLASSESSGWASCTAYFLCKQCTVSGSLQFTVQFPWNMPIAEYQLEIDRASQAADYAKASELKYSRLAELERRLRDKEAALGDASTRLLKEEVDEGDIADVVSRWTGIPVSKLLEGELQKLLSLDRELHRRVIGQDEAVTAVAEAIVRARSGLGDPHRPLGSFLFLGPTGVGKTELARALAEFLFDDERAMIRIDMSEYQEKHTVARLMGAPAGYVG